MNAEELAKMLDRARELRYDKSALDFITGWIEAHLKRENPEFDSNEFLFRSGFTNVRKI